MREVILNYDQLDTLSSAIIQEGGYFRFRARGASMYPAIRNGDVITIQPATASAMNVGDVAFFRRPDHRVVVHRVVKKVLHNSGLFLTMRGDSAPQLIEVITPEQVLGRVIAIQRGRRTIHLDRGFQRWVATVLAQDPPLGAGLFTAAELGKRLAGKLLINIQRLKIYRSSFRRLIGRDLRLRVATPEDAALLSRLFNREFIPRWKIPDEAKTEQTDRQPGYQETLIATHKGKIVGAVNLNLFPEDAEIYSGMWLFGLIVKTRYRGAGIGERLTRYAVEKSAQAGAERLNLLSFVQNTPANDLYYKLGFQPASNPALESVLDDETGQGYPRRIFLSKTIKPTE